MLRNYYSSIVLFFLAIIVFALKIYIPQANYIAYDNYGNYLHLPAKFIYNDLEFKTDWYKQLNEKYKSTPTYYQLMQTENGSTIIRFPKGMSYIWAPAFFTGHYIAKSTGYDADGFSKPYQWALILYGAFFSVLGMYFARKILLHYFNDITTAITLLVFFAGTNIFFFMTIGNDVPHVFLFALLSALLWFTIKWHKKGDYLNSIGIGVSLGLIIAVRPSDIIMAIIPIFYQVYDKEALKRKLLLIKDNYPKILLICLIVVAIMIPQFIYYYKYSGSFFINVYNHAGSTLNLSHPRFAWVLFSFRKGWLIYSPLCILSIVGLIFMYRRCKELFWPSLLFLAVNLYLIASFTSLLGYGWRAFIQSYAVLLVPFAIVVEYVLSKKIYVKLFSTVIVSLLTTLNIHQAWQINVGILSGSRMTKEYYFAILGKSHINDETRKLMLVERPDSAIEHIPENVPSSQVQLLDLGFNENKIDSLNVTPYEGKGAFIMGSNTRFSPGLKIPYNNITENYYCYLRASAYIYADSTVDYKKIQMVLTTITKENKQLKYKAANFSDSLNFIPGQWNKLCIDYLTPEIIYGDEQIVSYLWYTGEEKILVDNYQITAFIPDK